MPVELLSKSERAKLSRFPEKIPREDLRHYFTLSEEDREAAGRLYGDANPLGFALALSVLRYLGFFPPDLTDAPEEAACYVADQIGARPDVLEEYGTRAQTTRKHKRQAIEHLGFRRHASITSTGTESIASTSRRSRGGWASDRFEGSDRPANRPFLFVYYRKARCLSADVFQDRCFRTGASRVANRPFWF